MKEIGGYMDLERSKNPLLHEGALALNSARNCLSYLVRAKNIRRIALPNFLCKSVAELCRERKMDIFYYSINEHFLPVDDQKIIGGGYCLYLVNYYGQLTREQIRYYQTVYPQIIVDNVQAYFDEPVSGVDTIYTCRKFFGVPDGAFLYTNMYLKEDLEQDVSYNRMIHILGRFDTSASEHYGCYTAHEQAMEHLPLRRMSRLTENILRGIDYAEVKERRTNNFNYLFGQLSNINRLEVRPVSGAYAYPLWITKGMAVRKKLIAEKIYVPTLWPNVIEEQPETSLAYDLAVNLLPLPCDQRYGESEMRFICEQVVDAIGEIDR